MREPKQSDRATAAAGEARARGRVASVEAMLRRAIAEGRYPVGAKLPTEAALTRDLGVSRTVLREAVAALRAEGLLASRQGAGVFVLRRAAAPAPLALLTDEIETIAGVIEELELRAAVEIEAAGLAAMRASPAQRADIDALCAAFSAAATAGRATEDADFAFHLGVARAANNARFEAFLAHLGRRTIPRVAVRAALGEESAPARDRDLDAEHRAIAAAIVTGEAAQAREAMRAHLVGSIQRYRALIHGSARAMRA